LTLILVQVVLRPRIASIITSRGSRNFTTAR